MVYKLLFLSLALTIHLSASQILTVSPTCIQDGDLVKLRCQTTDFVSAISFLLSGTNKGGCTANSGSCGTGITGYVGPSQSGLFTELTISAYDHSRDGGSWTCEYGGTPSSIYAVKIGNCPVVTVTEMSSACTSIDHASSSHNPSTVSFQKQKTETTIMTTTENGLSSATLHLTSEVKIAMKTNSDSSIQLTVDATTENGLTPESPHKTSEVTMTMKIDSDNSIQLTVGAIITFVISVFMFLILVIILVFCCCRHRCRKHTKQQTKEKCRKMLSKTNVKQNSKISQFKQNSFDSGYFINEITVLSRRVTHNDKKRPRDYDNRLTNPVFNQSNDQRFPQSMLYRNVNREERPRLNSLSLSAKQNDNQNIREYNFCSNHTIRSPRRSENSESYCTRDYIYDNRRFTPKMRYVRAHVSQDYRGVIFYQGPNKNIRTTTL